MKNLFSFLLIACALLCSTVSVSAAQVQENLDNNVFVFPGGPVEYDYVILTSEALPDLVLHRYCSDATYFYTYTIPTKIATFRNSCPGRTIKNYTAPFVKDKDVIWLTNMKSK